MRILLGLLAVAIYSGITIYIGWGLRAWLQSLQLYRWPVVFWLVLFICAFGFVLARIHPLLEPLLIVGYSWMFVLQYGLFILMIGHLLVWLTPLSVKVVGTGAVSLFVLLFACGLYYAYSPVTRELTIELDQQGEDLRVVVAADFHLGLLSHKGHLEKFVEMSNEAKPDVVLLPGDLVDDVPTRFIKEDMGAVMKQLRATYGVYGVLGNHDYYGNQVEKIEQAMQEADVQLLRDETIIVENRFVLTGQEDRTNKERLPLAQLTPDNKELPWFVMNHTPDDLQTPAALGVDFHVSGHTHRGQMWPNQYMTERIFDLDYGHEMFGQMHGLVTSGFGFWGPPTRIGTRAELWVVDVRFKN